MIHRFFSSLQTTCIGSQALPIGAKIISSTRGKKGSKYVCLTDQLHEAKKGKPITFQEAYSAALQIRACTIVVNELVEKQPFVKTAEEAKAAALRAKILASGARFEAEKIARAGKYKTEKSPQQEKAVKAGLGEKAIAERGAKLLKVVKKIESSVEMLQKKAVQISRKTKSKYA